MGQWNLLGRDVPTCAGCGEALGNTPHLNEGDTFCTVECSDVFDEKVAQIWK